MPQPQTVFSFTTSPKRIHLCGAMVQSVLNQTVQPDLILLNIPEVFQRTGERYSIPDELAKRVTVNVTKHDYGPATKIVPTIAYLRDRHWPEDTMIVYGDDDIRYLPRTLETYRQLSPDAVWCTSGFDIIDGRIRNAMVEPYRSHGQRVSVPEGFASVCTRLSFFDPYFEPYMARVTHIDDMKFSDDVSIANYLWKRGIAVRLCYDPEQLNLRYMWASGSILDYGKQPDALHMGASGLTVNNVERYKRVLDSLKGQGALFIPTYTTRVMNDRRSPGLLPPREQY